MIGLTLRPLYPRLPGKERVVRVGPSVGRDYARRIYLVLLAIESESFGRPGRSQSIYQRLLVFKEKTVYLAIGRYIMGLLGHSARILTVIPSEPLWCFL
jgi:hypothetical protein